MGQVDEVETTFQVKDHCCLCLRAESVMARLWGMLHIYDSDVINRIDQNGVLQRKLWIRFKHYEVMLYVLRFLACGKHIGQQSSCHTWEIWRLGYRGQYEGEF